MKNNFGRFSITKNFFEHNLDMIQEIMSKVIVVRCEFFYHKDAFEYTAISRYFAEIKEGGKIPEYRVIIEMEDIDHFNIKFQKIICEG